MLECCSGIDKCPIYSGILQGKEFTTKAYKKMYCEAGEEGRNNCKRWQVKQRYGACPPNLLPNSIESVESIGKAYNLI